MSNHLLNPIETDTFDTSSTDVDIEKFDVFPNDNEPDLIQKNLNFRSSLNLENILEQEKIYSNQKSIPLDSSSQNIVIPTKFYSSPNIIILFGESTNDCELLAYNLHKDLLEKSNWDSFLTFNEDNTWNPKLYLNIQSIALLDFKTIHSKILSLSSILNNPGNIKYIFIILNNLSIQLMNIVEFYPHWLFNIEDKDNILE